MKFLLRIIANALAIYAAVVARFNSFSGYAGVLALAAETDGATA